MKVLAINGSMKAKNSCTDKILQPFLTGMQKAGAETETIYLAEKYINHCTVKGPRITRIGPDIFDPDLADTGASMRTRCIIRIAAAAGRIGADIADQCGQSAPQSLVSSTTGFIRHGHNPASLDAAFRLSFV